MRTLRTVPELRAALASARCVTRRVGLVPTMGALHDGHLSLIARARADCEIVVVSLFVNPTQFGPSEDLAAYPRDEARDARLAAQAGADLLFAPAVGDVYPAGFATTVTVDGVSEGLCGAHRGPEHFAGVATVVTKLLNMVGPDVAYFGQKDAQQVAVIRRVVRDLDLPVGIEVCPTVRDADGLALSSRNAYLDPDARARATALWHGLCAAREVLLAGAGDPDPAIAAAAARAAMTARGVEPEYVELVDPDTMRPLDVVAGPVLVAVAARVGKARLIDNLIVTRGPAQRTGPHDATSGPARAASRQQSAERPDVATASTDQPEMGAAETCSA